MRSYFKLPGYSLFFCFVLLFIVSCKNDDKENKSADDSTEKAKMPAPASLFPTTLDTLFIDRQAFDTLNSGSKLIFCHTIAANNKINLHGWVLETGNTFSTSPNMKLTNGNTSTINLSGDIYFGNIVLSPSDFNKIKNALNNQLMRYLIFSPKIVDNNHIGYDITVSRNQSLVTSQEALVTAEANPSPPKNY
jgi:hypothetical protein